MPNFKLPGLCRAFLLLVLVLASITPAHSAPWPRGDIPSDPAVSFGVLPNGMRYAIMRNDKPAGEVSVRFGIAAGALQESPAQKGLAHFLEHMAFRGSAHLADGEINKSLQRLGLRLGADVNASTEQERTLYKFDLPTSDEGSVDAALNFVREIAGNLSLDPAAIKTEAGVVLSELKLRDTPFFRAARSRLEFLLQDPHASALPIGDAAIVTQASAALIRDYYRAYYRPERATLIVVGDIDPARIEAKIKSRFVDWQGMGEAGGDPDLAISFSRGPEAKLFSQPGAPSQTVISWNSPPDPDPNDKAQDRLVQINMIGLRIVNLRLREAAAAAAPAFSSAQLSRAAAGPGASLTSFSISHEPGRWQPAVAAAESIRLDAIRSGVTQAEVDRAVAERRRAFQRASAATRESAAIANVISSEASTGHVIVSPAGKLAMLDEELKDLGADDVTRALRDDFRGSGPLIFVSDPVAEDEAAITEAFVKIEETGPSPSATATQPPEPVSWPYTDFGPPGAVTETRLIADLGTSFVRFANGVRLTVRPSQLRANQVLISVKVGNGRLDLPKDRITPAWAAGAVTAGGLKAMSYNQMQRALAAKAHSVGFSVADDGFVFSGQTITSDIDTQLQLLAAYLQAPGFRPEGFEQVRNARIASLRSQSTPQAILQSKTPEVLHDGDKRWASPAPQDVRAATVDDLRAMLEPVFAQDAIDITIVGDVTTDKAVQAVAATFGALPVRADRRTRAGADNGTHLPAGGQAPIVTTGSLQQGQEILSVCWPTHGQFLDSSDAAAIDLLGAIMRQGLSDRLRGQGIAYVSSAGSVSSKTFDYGFLQASAQLPPDRAKEFYDSIDTIAADLKAGRITQDDLVRARNPALQQLRRSRQTNAYWLSALDGAQQDESRLELARISESLLQRVAVADVVAAARRYLTNSRMIRLVVGPP